MLINDQYFTKLGSTKTDPMIETTMVSSNERAIVAGSMIYHHYS